MLRVPYQTEPLRGPASPTLPAGATSHWRPLLPILVLGPTGLVRRFSRALLDSGADDTIFSLDTARRLQVQLLADTGHRIRWRGQPHPLRFGPVELQLTDGPTIWQWSTVVGFSPAPIAYPILGLNGCLQFMDARFLGDDLAVELEANRSYRGIIT